MRQQGLPIRITRAVSDTLQEGARSAHHQGKETCFLLFAERGVIVHAIRAGQPIEHAAMTRPDFAAADAVTRDMIAQGFNHVGQAHIHLGYPGASSGDISTLRDVAKAGSPGYVCIVANITGDGPATLTGHTVDAEGKVYDHAIEVVDERPAYEPLIPLARRKMKALHCGVGTGGCTVLHHEALFGLDEVTVLEHDEFEERNALRHYVDRRTAKKRVKKGRWAKSFYGARTTSKLRTITRQITPQNRSWLQRIVRRHDLVIDCTGHPIARQLLSEACKAARKPLVSAGVFEQASGGFVFLQDTEEQDACTSGCLFNLTKHTRNDDRQTLDALARDYGFTPEQLDAQQGTFTDVTMVAALQAKVILEFIKGITHPANLYLIDNQALTLRKAFVKQSATCTNCHPELLERSI
jgi:hypothetical protein